MKLYFKFILTINQQTIEMFIYKNMKIVLLCYLIFSLIPPSLLFNYQKLLNTALTRGKDLYKSRFGKDKTWNFLGYDQTEYPGTNKNYRRIQREKWQEYYDCLLEQEENLKNHGSVIPEAVLAIEGESVKFECEICLSPSEREDINSIEWEWSSIYDNHLEPLETTEHILISPEDKTLHLYNLQIDQTGQYVCKLKNQLTAPYFLTVVNASEPMQEVHRKRIKNKNHPEPPWMIHSEIVLDTMWGKWSPCSNCDKVGKKRKFGYCIILLLENFKELFFNNVSTTTLLQDDIGTNNSTVKKRNNSEFGIIQKHYIHLSPEDMEILHIFKYGIPCRSHILSETLRNAKYIKERKSEIFIKLCKVKCEGDTLFVVKDKAGNVIEMANNSAGIYSMLQGMPNIEPTVERRLIFATTETQVILTCPGNLNSDVPIHWQIGSKHIVPELLSKESNGRMFVTILDRITIKKAKISDSNIYSCWQDNELTGTVRLIVEKKMLDFNYHIMLFTTVVIMKILFVILIKAFLNRNKNNY